MNYYEELGIRSDADEEEIRKAHRRLVKLMHPDQHRDQNLKQLAETQMRRLNSIVAVLLDPEERADYDEQLRTGGLGGEAVNGAPQQSSWRSVPWWIASTLGAIILTVGTIWLVADRYGPRSRSGPVVEVRPGPETTEPPIVEKKETLPPAPPSGSSDSGTTVANVPVPKETKTDTVPPVPLPPPVEEKPKVVEAVKHEEPKPVPPPVKELPKVAGVPLTPTPASANHKDTSPVAKQKSTALAQNPVTAMPPKPATPPATPGKTATAMKQNPPMPNPPAEKPHVVETAQTPHPKPPIFHGDLGSTTVRTEGRGSGEMVARLNPPTPYGATNVSGGPDVPPVNNVRLPPPPPRNPLEGDWVFAPASPERKKPGFFVPEFIHLSLVKDTGGGMRGEYSARYTVDRPAVSPDVSFSLRATDQSGMKYVWTAANGAHGTLTIETVESDVMRLEWRDTGKVNGHTLSSGVATLVRKN